MSMQDAGELPALSLNSEIDPAEPRVRDLDLAERLGMAKPHAIRELIEANRAELEAYGNLSAAPTNPEIFPATPEKSSARRRGRPGREYWLNEGQALLVCILSRTARAPAVRRRLITTYQAARAGRLAPEARALAAPAEPPFCPGCFARLSWHLRSAAENQHHALRDGPLTGFELAQIAVFRCGVKDAAQDLVTKALAAADAAARSTLKAL